MILCLAILLVTVCSAQDASPSVDVTYSAGTVRGIKVDYGTNTTQFLYGKGDIFLGIPFAQPPIGNLRFQKPVPTTRLPANPYEATVMKPVCPQPNRDYMSEDCLYLNVYSPDVNSAVKYPVMIWIHGGALLVGGASDVPYKGAVRNFVSRGIVLVVIQYRLGMLGFFTTFSEEFPANVGMLDQVEAINWTKNNIAAFGGDPNRITLFGISAGGCSVSAHTYSPMTQNLFQGAIMESGSVLTCFDGALGFTDIRQKRAQQVCNITTDQWNNNNLQGLKQCLMAADPKTFLQYDNDMFGWKIVQDNSFLPNIPDNLASTRPNIPIMIGNSRDEWALFDFNKSTFEFFLNTLGAFMTKIDPRIQTMIENVYLPPGTADNDSITWLKTSSDAFTAAIFTGFIGREVQHYLSNNNSQVYLYEFTHWSALESLVYPMEKIPGWNPVVHGAEYPFVFAIAEFWEVAADILTPEDYEMLDWFAQTWTDFAKLGIPNTPIAWDPVADSSLQYYQIDSVSPGMQREYRKKDQVLFNQVLPVLIGEWPPYSINYKNATLNNVQSNS